MAGEAQETQTAGTQTTETQASPTTTGAAQAAAQQAGSQGAGADTDQGAGTGKGGSGDTTVALRQERQRRREEAARRRSLEQRLAQIEQTQGSGGNSGTGSGGNGGGGALNIPEPELSEEDLEDPQKLSAKWSEYIQQVVPQLEERVAQRATQSVSASQNMQSEADAIIRKYTEFTQEDDPQARQDALRLLDAELEALPEGATIDDVDAAAAEVAKRTAQYRAHKSAAENNAGGGQEDQGAEGPASVGAGSAESAHITPTEEVPKNRREARQAAKKLSPQAFKALRNSQ